VEKLEQNAEKQQTESKVRAEKEFCLKFHPILKALQIKMSMDITKSKHSSVADLLGRRPTLSPDNKAKLQNFEEKLGDLNEFQDLIVQNKEFHTQYAHQGEPGKQWTGPLNQAEMEKLMNDLKIDGVSKDC